MKTADPATGREISPRPVKGAANSLARGMITSVSWGGWEGGGGEGECNM